MLTFFSPWGINISLVFLWSHSATASKKKTGSIWWAGHEPQQASSLEIDSQRALVTDKEDMKRLLKVQVVAPAPTFFCCSLSVALSPTSNFLPGGCPPVSWRIKPVSLIPINLQISVLLLNLCARCLCLRWSDIFLTGWSSVIPGNTKRAKPLRASVFERRLIF